MHLLLFENGEVGWGLKSCNALLEDEQHEVVHVNPAPYD